MRLSAWRAAAPAREAVSAKVLAVVEPVLAALGCGKDPECWFDWGDDPAVRYAILVPTSTGLVSCNVRVNIPQVGPRASAKLSRWNRVQVGELGIETQGPHRLLSFQVEGHVLRGADADADAVAAFAIALLAAIDGRPIPEHLPQPASRSRPARSARAAPSGRPKATGAAPAARGTTAPARGGGAHGRGPAPRRPA